MAFAAVPSGTGCFSGVQALRALTINHRNVGLDALTDSAVSAEAAAAMRETLRAAGIDAFVLTTCNRTEIYWQASGADDDERVRAQLAALSPSVETEAAAASGTLLRGRDAAAHLFRVCSGVESLVVGEAEILGQVRTALDLTPGIGPFLLGVVQAALRAGRMARAETAVGVGALSVASGAVQWLSTAIPIPQSRVVIVGAGATGLKVARHLKSLGVRDLIVANRTLARAAAVAAEVGADAVSLDLWQQAFADADAVVCAVAASAPVVSLGALRDAVAARASRPLVIVDLSMPPVVEPGEVAGVVRVDLSVLEPLVAEHRDRRAAEVPKVQAIVDRELQHLDAWARHHALRPLVSDLRRKVEAIRQAELARAIEELEGGQATDVRVLERLSRRLLDQLLAIPLGPLQAGHVPIDPAQAQYLRRLFGLEPESRP